MEKNIICKTLGGSHAYGLSTPASDIDVRGIFAHTDIHNIIGLGRYEHQQDKSEGKDEEFKEFRSALALLRQANTQMVELLFNEKWQVITPLWENVIANRFKLIDSKKLFNCLMGYSIGELRLANGERTGKLGGKRKASIDDHGFSEKNYVQCLRLLWAGEYFFASGVFPVDVCKVRPDLAKKWIDIKINPRNYKKEELNEWVAELQIKLKLQFDGRKFDYHFDEDLADAFCVMAYGQLIAEKHLYISALSGYS